MGKRLVKWLVLFCIGGILYLLIETAARGHSHWTMGIVGGICFLLIGAINEKIPRKTGLVYQMILGSLLVTGVEFCAGVLLNLVLGLGIWDYSHLPLNLLGQVCLIYSVFWMFLALAGILIDDWIRWRLFGQEKPRYRLI